MEKENRILQFVKDWTLPVSIFTGIAAYLVFALIPALDAAGTAMAPFFDAMLPVFMFCVLFVTFCKVDYRKLRPVWWHLWVGVFQVLTIALVMPHLPNPVATKILELSPPNLPIYGMLSTVMQSCADHFAVIL